MVRGRLQRRKHGRASPRLLTQSQIVPRTSQDRILVGTRNVAGRLWYHYIVSRCLFACPYMSGQAHCPVSTAAFH
ncbi:hypothetical protein KCU73_g125, partial [Aureobasidium melanogenum]